MNATIHVLFIAIQADFLKQSTRDDTQMRMRENGKKSTQNKH